MRREFHVRFCEGPGVRSLRATRLVVLCKTAKDWFHLFGRSRRRAAAEALAAVGLDLRPGVSRTTR